MGKFKLLIILLCGGILIPYAKAQSNSETTYDPSSPFCVANGCDTGDTPVPSPVASDDGTTGDIQKMLDDQKAAVANCPVQAQAVKKACGSMNEDMMGAMLLTQTVSQGMQASQNAAVAASGQAIVGSAGAAMTYQAASRCMEKANACFSSCSKASTSPGISSAKRAEYTGIADECQTVAQRAKSQSYVGMAQGLNAGMSGLAAYQNMSASKQGSGAVPPTPEMNTAAMAAPQMGAGGEVSPSIPNPTNAMAYHKIDGGGVGTPASGEGGGSGGAFGGGSAYPGGAGNSGQNSGGGGGSGLNNPTLGINGGSGGGYNVSGVPLSGGGGGGYRGGGNSNDSAHAGMNMDFLSKFLPGGDRAPASEGGANNMFQAQGITADGNGLPSNFEKVSRVMNKRRPYMNQ